jgi:urea transport system substrate-binding protein
MVSDERNKAPGDAKAADSTTNSGLHGSAAPSAETSADLPRGRGQSGNPDAWVGKSLGKYKITQVLGQGGMGVVFKAHDPMIERDVAIKVLADHLAADSTALARFLAEARAAGKLAHANVMAIYEICQEGSTNYLVLEYVPGGSLDDHLTQRHCLSVLEATQAITDACRGVGAAHAVGLIHRDIKPANFMRAADGSIKVADFGLAKAAGDAGHHLTRTGMVVGTPYFMSPEQCEAKPTDQRSDIYSLGATYYELLTGKSPYEDSDSVTQVMYGHCHGPIPDPRSVNPALPEVCSRIVARAMAKAPADRYQSTAEMLADLQAVVAALSGQAPIMLPSQSGTRPVGGIAGRQRFTRGRRLAVYGTALGLVALIGFIIAFWKPWSGTAVAPPATEPVKVGVLHSLSGTMAASEAPVVDAVLFAIDEVNQSGGVLGRPVKAVVADGRSHDSVFAQEAERLITEEKVPTVFGCWTSSSRKTVKAVFEQHDHLLIYPLQYEGLETSPCIVYMGAAPNQQILPALEWAMTTLDKKRCFLVGSDYVFPRAANAIIKDHLKSTQAQVVGEEYVPLGSQHFEDILEAIKKAQPDLILNTINGDSNVGFFRELREAGISSAKAPTLSFSVGEQGIRTLDAADLEGDYAAWTYFESIPGPENEGFVARFRAVYPRHRVSDPMETAYLGVKLWAKAVNEAQSLEPKKIRRALLNQSMKGPGGAVRIDADTQHCSRTPRIAQIQSDGRFKIVWTAAEPIHPEPYPKSRTAEAWRAFLNDLYTGWGNRWAAPEPDRFKTAPTTR